MGQTNLGEREQFTVRVPKDADLKSIATAEGYTAVSRWLSDLACRAADRPDLVLGPDREEQPQLQLAT